MLIEEQRDDMVHIIGCIKRVIDPEAPLSTFKIDPARRPSVNRLRSDRS